MNYNEFIQNIINTRGQWCESVKISSRTCERHHIIPRCIGGKGNNKSWTHHENIIWLYPEEHFIAHKLLAEENPDNIKLCSAFWLMCNSHKGQISADEYENARINWTKIMRRPKSEKTKQKIRDNAKINPNFGMSGKKHSEETKIKIGAANSIALKGRKIPAEIVENMTKSHIGLIWWTNGFNETKSKNCPGIGWRKGRMPHIVSDTAKINMAIANKKSHSKKVLCITNNKIYNSASEASIELNVTRSSICCCCKNKLKHTKGLEFCYA